MASLIFTNSSFKKVINPYIFSKQQYIASILAKQWQLAIFTGLTFGSKSNVQKSTVNTLMRNFFLLFRQKLSSFDVACFGCLQIVYSLYISLFTNYLTKLYCSILNGLLCFGFCLLIVSHTPKPPPKAKRTDLF